MRSFARQTRTGAGKRGTDRGDEAFPSRGPLDEELGLVVQVGRAFELEGVGHGRSCGLVCFRLVALDGSPYLVRGWPVEGARRPP
jgi:hypothetical protein